MDYQVRAAKTNAHNIAFSWNGLPQYAARALRAAIHRLGRDCVVIGSKPKVPVKGIEEALGQRVIWIEADTNTTWNRLGLDVPDIFIQSGWSYPAFSSLGQEVKANGGRIIGLSDANWRGDFRQTVFGAAAFRLLYRGHFDAMIVPGAEGVRLMRHFGMPRDRIFTGMYAADPTLFHAGPSLPDREKIILFVGQLIERKDVLGLARAFLVFSESNPEWRLHIAGAGPQRDLIPRHSNILVEDFVQPESLAKRYHSARFFVLPSKVEAWGVVVHEATLCGCALILSDKIGSGPDLATPQNALKFRSGSFNGLLNALKECASRDAPWLEHAEQESLRLAQQFSPSLFADSIETLIAHFR